MKKRVLVRSLVVAGAAVVGFASALSVVEPASAALPTCTSWLSVVSSNPHDAPSLSNGSVSCQLKRGNSGEGVRALQNSMDMCYNKSLNTDGQFGALTEAALRSVQSSVGTSADGEYGPNTRRAMKFWDQDGCSHL